MREFSICRPDSKHWCVQCCLKRGDGNSPCCNLGKLSDGTRGCLGNNTASGLSELPKLVACKDMPYYCIPEALSSPDGIKRISEKILARPQGEFDISDITKNLLAIDVC